jgi:hypothetical protein
MLIFGLWHQLEKELEKELGTIDSRGAGTFRNIL